MRIEPDTVRICLLTICNDLAKKKEKENKLPDSVFLLRLHFSLTSVFFGAKVKPCERAYSALNFSSSSSSIWGASPEVERVGGLVLLSSLRLTPYFGFCAALEEVTEDEEAGVARVIRGPKPVPSLQLHIVFLMSKNRNRL